MKELKIGETITIKCVGGADCGKCALSPDLNCTISKFKCRYFDREDGKNVHFEIVDTSVEIDTKVANLVSMHLADERAIWMEKAERWIDEYFPTRGKGESTFIRMEAVIDCFHKFMEESK